jgi:murein L,D-transpeptidase YafK
MKTTLLLSCVLAGAGFLMNSSSGKNAETVTYNHASSTMSRKKTTARPIGSVKIIISKKKYELSVYDERGWYATYPVVFGNSSLADKKMEGDKNTPEGSFQIANKRVHEKWARYLGLNYPTQESLSKFAARKQRGEIPRWASPGGGIGIHGCWPREDFVVDRYTNWTDGCIALKRADVADLYSYVPVGTPIYIQK